MPARAAPPGWMDFPAGEGKLLGPGRRDPLKRMGRAQSRVCRLGLGWTRWCRYVPMSDGDHVAPWARRGLLRFGSAFPSAGVPPLALARVGSPTEVVPSVGLFPPLESGRGHCHVNLMGWQKAFAWGMVAG
jgi:hypothetical protein